MTVTLIASRPATPDRLQRIGDWLARNEHRIRRGQWLVVLVYFSLLAVPALLPLPGSAAFIWTDLTRFAQFVFWGLWWPFVLLSTALVGRVWCGLLCPEGMLTELASSKGRGGAIPRWMQWAGWPTVAFACTTVYGQMVSVYQYPKPALLILGGSTLGAVVVGFLYGKGKRVWCRFLCPVNGVFGLLSKLAPLQFTTDATAWRASQAAGDKPRAINCAPLVPLRTLESSSPCHMCGRCSGFRGAIRLARRSPSHEIVHVAGRQSKPWETVLIVFGLMGIAAGAFHWSASPWYVAAKQALAGRLVDLGLLWPLETAAPWWVLTDYPAKNDVMTLLDGAVMLAYIAATALALGGAVCAALALAARSLGPFRATVFHHLAQTLIPVAGAGVFLGLSALTVSQLHMDGIDLPGTGTARAAFLAAAALWSLSLAWQVAGRYARGIAARAAAVAAMAAALAVADAGWVALFWVW